MLKSVCESNKEFFDVENCETVVDNSTDDTDETADDTIESDFLELLRISILLLII